MLTLYAQGLIDTSAIGELAGSLVIILAMLAFFRVVWTISNKPISDQVKFMVSQRDEDKQEIAETKGQLKLLREEFGESKIERAQLISEIASVKGLLEAEKVRRETVDQTNVYLRAQIAEPLNTLADTLPSMVMAWKTITEGAKDVLKVHEENKARILEIHAVNGQILSSIKRIEKSLDPKAQGDSSGHKPTGDNDV